MRLLGQLHHLAQGGELGSFLRCQIALQWLFLRRLLQGAVSLAKLGEFPPLIAGERALVIGFDHQCMHFGLRQRLWPFDWLSRGLVFHSVIITMAKPVRRVRANDGAAAEIIAFAHMPLPR
ncbi:hypothetical protein CHU93_16710 [Sandarakinorhabdus cyanobacteriorum]|uniref:Uncharacterized protein n=1 Tax=Sandarakinorhabdus cyanobacteriorum TaxID=1981098 RepID=A0A255Y3T4_9SPHN|nr:hypothetical protein CHU93_16710 [Sandarakinorhabdus cyanobacteriorum]